jgi:hypothetical protein
MQAGTHTNPHTTHIEIAVVRNNTTLPSHNHGSSTSFKTPFHTIHNAHKTPIAASTTYNLSSCKQVVASPPCTHTHTHIMQANNTSSRLVINPMSETSHQ